METEKDREEPVRAIMERMVSGSDFPAISAHISAAMAILTKEDASFQYLANIILKDHSLTLQVLRTANSPYYRRCDGKILSVTQAIMLLGTRNLRTLASTLMVFEHYNRHFPGLKELMSLSILTAFHAREVAMHVGYEKPEEAYLYGMFRNLGEMLVACYCPDEYAAITARVQKEGETSHEACRHVLRFNYEDLAEAAARYWGIPSLGTPAESDLQGRMEPILSFSEELTHAVYRRDTRAEQAVPRLLERYGEKLRLTAGDIRQILRSGLSESEGVLSDMNVRVSDLVLEKRDGKAPSGPHESTVPEAPEEPARPECPWSEKSRERLIEEVESATEVSSPLDLNQTLLLIMEAMYRSGPFDHVALCVVTPDKRTVRGRFGLGDHLDRVLERIWFPLASSARESPVGHALLRKTDLFLWSRERLTPAERECLSAMEVEMIGVLAIVVEEKLIGAFYLDRVSSPEPPDEAAVSYVRSLRNHAEKALARSRDQKLPASPRAAADVSSAEKRYDIVLRHLRGESIESLGRETGVAHAEIEKWVKCFLSSALAGLKGAPKN
ncbi:MAG: HDOD domain-containing protein [bacterium]